MEPLQARTLGDVLYANSSQTLESEKNWVQLAQSLATGDRAALHALYERTHRPVYTLIMRLTSNPETAEELTLEIFDDLWRRASRYDPAKGTVLGWIMNQARAKALDWLRLEEKQRRAHPADYGNVPQSREQSRLLSGADVLSPAPSLQERLARSIAGETGAQPVRAQWSEPEWEDVAPRISCKLLATDMEKHVVSMLVRLAPGGEYPPHTHAGSEELHLLHGELWIDERKLYPGDYNRVERGTSDKRVWSETGCTCVLVTSTKDALG